MLKLENIYKKLGSFELKNINLHIKKNEYFVILGPTGAGKTIILDMIAGMYKPDSGQIYIDNQLVNNLEAEARNISYVYQDYMLFPHLNVYENIIFSQKIKKTGSNLQSRLDNICGLLKIGHLYERDVENLSGGEKQRVALARALISQPKILLMDEPLSALDPKTKEELQIELARIQKELKITVVHICHDFNEALFLADRIAVLNSGEIIEVGDAKKIFERPNKLFTAEFTGIKNLYKGINTNKVAVIEGQKDILIKNESELNGNVFISIKSEDIIIEKDQEGPYDNIIQGRISEIIPKGIFVKIILEGKIRMEAALSKKDFINLKLDYGDLVFAKFNKDSVHVIAKEVE